MNEQMINILPTLNYLNGMIDALQVNQLKTVPLEMLVTLRDNLMIEANKSTEVKK